MEQSNNSKRHRSKLSSSSVAIHNGTNRYLDNNNHHQIHMSMPIQPPTSSSSPCSAYFITRRNLNDYTIDTLKQTVDSVVSGPKSKGLKVKLTLPDEGLIIDNVLDPNQSWMYKASELLYFWRDFYYINTIVIITSNRANHPYAIEPYSASIFRLRGNESVQLFIQRAQQFFAQLSTLNISKNNSKIFIEKSATTENLITDNHKKKHHKKSKHHSKTNKESVSQPFPSSKITTDHSVIRTEFDPKKTNTTTTDSNFDLYDRRAYSETTVLSDTQTSNSKKLTNNNDDDDDDKITSMSRYFPSDYVADLLHELKELRNEIAALKLDARFTPVHSTSESPVFGSRENINYRKDFLQSEIDAETQTDLSSFNDNTKMDISNENLVTNKRKNEQSNRKINKRTVSNGLNNIESDREEITLVNSSRTNDLSNEISSSYKQEEYSSSSLPMKSVIIEKETPNSSSIPMDIESSSLPKETGEVVSFHESLENTIPPPNNIYENLPILIQMNSNQNFYHNLPSVVNQNDQQKGNERPLYVTITGDHDSELQKQYLSQLFGSQESIQNNILNHSVTSNNQKYFKQVLFSDHLTNPLFNVDKQLLENTIANQFGIDLKSPYLQKLIANQHLFVTHKRTFANMIWQITPEEENALCSSPDIITSNIIDTNTVDTNSLTAKSILKLKKSSRSVSKGQRISWDNTLE